MSDADEFQDKAPKAKEPFADYKQFHDMYNLEEIEALAEDYKIWCIVGMLPGLEHSQNDYVPLKRRRSHRRPTDR
jgi:hypothetical protein